MERGVNPDLGLAILRVVVGVIFIAHGADKIFVSGVEGTAGFLGSLGIPLPLATAWMIALLEFLGGLALVVGLLVTPVALLLAIHMFVGIVLVHAQNGFFVIGPGSGGIEFNLLLIASLLVLVFGGPGIAAIDSRRAGIAT
jgi:putative oxidoreductase